MSLYSSACWAPPNLLGGAAPEHSVGEFLSEKKHASCLLTSSAWSCCTQWLQLASITICKLSTCCSVPRSSWGPITGSLSAQSSSVGTVSLLRRALQVGRAAGGCARPTSEQVRRQADR